MFRKGEHKPLRIFYFYEYLSFFQLQYGRYSAHIVIGKIAFIGSYLGVGWYPQHLTTRSTRFV